VPEFPLPANSMGDRVSKPSNRVSRDQVSSRDFAVVRENTDFYTRSSLAIDPKEDTFVPRPRVPQLVPSVPAPSAVSGIPTFAGLDKVTATNNRKSRTISFVLHLVIIAGVLWLTLRPQSRVIEKQIMAPINITLYAPPPPPKVLPVSPKQGGGGGGGAHEIPPPIKGKPPEVVKPAPVVLAPQVLKLDHPKLPMAPSEPVNIPENTKLANLGAPDSPQVKLASQGSGGGSGFGQGMGGGLGMGQGLGAGPGRGGGYGGGIMSVGGGVSAPVVIHSVEPEFTDEARRQDFQGTCEIQLIIDSQGNPQNVHVIRHLGEGLDEKAVEAVQQYRFKPAMFQGHPVAVQMIISVDFHLH